MSMYMMHEVWKIIKLKEVWKIIKIKRSMENNKIKIKHKLVQVKIIILKCALERVCVQNCRSLCERINFLQLPFCPVWHLELIFSLFKAVSI